MLQTVWQMMQNLFKKTGTMTYVKQKIYSQVVGWIISIEFVNKR